MTHEEIEDFLKDLDDDDLKHIIVNYDEETIEQKFRWEFQHEGLSELDSVFRKIMPDR